MTGELKSLMHSVCLILALAALTRLTDANCSDDFGTGLLDLRIPENTPENTLLLNITSGDSLSLDRAVDTPFLKVVDGKIYTARNITVDGKENQEFCAQTNTYFFTKVRCRDKIGATERGIIISVTYTDDHQTHLILPPVSVKEQAEGFQILDWSVNKDDIVTDDDCGTDTSLEISMDLDEEEYFGLRLGPSLYTKKALDYETRTQHTLDVTAFSQLPGYDPVQTQGQLLINVVDVDDRDPVFVTPRDNDTAHGELMLNVDTLCKRGVFKLDIPETQETRERKAQGPPLTARDGDTGINAPLNYSIVSTQPALNASISSYGELFVSGPLDRERTQAYVILVRASQVDNPSASATATAVITVTDTNDNRPEFVLHQSDRATIALGASAGSYVTELQAEDADEGDNAEFNYTIHKDTGAFEVIDSPSGQKATLVVKNPAYLNTEKNITVEIRLIEKAPVAGGDICDFINTCAMNVTVTVKSLNSYTPLFTLPYYSMSIYQDQAPGVTFGEVHAVDNDKGTSGSIFYRLSQLPGDVDPDCGRIKVNSRTGELSLNEKMQHADVNCVYSAFACDKPLDENNMRCGSSVVVVTVIESPSGNDTVEPLQYDVHILEGVAIGTTVMALPVADLVTNNTNFSIADTLLKTAVVLDRESQDVHIVSIGTRNGTEFDETLRINVYVDNVNDNAPVFDRNDYEVTLAYDDSAGTVVLTVSATDADGPEDRLNYSLSHAGNGFIIDSSSGQIRLVKPASELIATAHGDFEILVEVVDSGEPPRTAVARVRVHILPPAFLLIPDDLMKNKSNIEREISELLGIPVQVLGVEESGGARNTSRFKTCLRATPQED